MRYLSTIPNLNLNNTTKVNMLHCVVTNMFTRVQSRTKFKRDYVIASVLLVNTFSWFFIGQKIVTEVANVFDKNLFLSLAFPVSIIVSAFIGAIFLANVRKTRVFYIWLLSGTIISLFLGFSSVSLFVALLAIVLLGVSLGLGIPSCLTYFADCVPIEKRGKVGGASLFITIFSVPLVVIVMSMLDFTTSVIIFAAWRAWSLPILFLLPKKYHRQTVNNKPFSLVSVFQNRQFVLYFVAWFMFSLVDGFEGLILDPHIGELRFFMGIIEPIAAGISALVGGILSDWIGRKRVLIFGFVSLGVAYAVIGLVSHWISWIFYFIVDGMALGLLWVLFVIVIWGDLSKLGREKYYAIGQMPFFLTMIASLLFAPYVALIPETSAFSVAAFFLFIAVIPLLSVRETLPEKKIQQRQLEIYTEEALKLRQKVEQKSK